MSSFEEKDEADDMGGFLLGSLATMETVEIQASDSAIEGDTPKAIVRPAVATVNTAKALRELREKQKKTEKRIAVLTGLVVFTLTFSAAAFQTGMLERGFEGLKQRVAAAQIPQRRVNCALPENRANEECVEKKAKTNSSWEGIERTPGGSVNHFSLNRM
jgi:hypothetical protein